MGMYFYDMSFGTRIRELRKERGLSQGELARKLGTSQKVISDYERERTSPPKDKLPNIARFFGLSIDTLLDIEDEPANGKNGKTLHGNKRTLKAMELFDQLDPIEQRIILRQMKALIEGKKHKLL
ncbi:helix-turn-helix transcriptional regulator [Chitinispirillales bacterium ANBcel5]|uniref:helix-turn-helix domain-containing protein n=1 Tax=Cellulosispirillum alkaliphilum TaxID=3039283 RepID=UPI002A519235|nr:helix-turn-helix transcriptional regulator [Chitinispirillales bacterium ANBcel5]